MTSYGRTLREWRAYLKKSKKELAKALGIHSSTYAKWEDHPQEIRVCEIPRLAAALGCEANEIIFFEENPSFKLGIDALNHLNNSEVGQP